ncbi:MAG: helix-turn-helix transcriptional regulator [Rhodospirillaceae bacterium]|nr:helix-turn-helix transcriptional regulator [Rhodospirillaceae bacterium]
MKRRPKITPGGDNVFADLGLPDAQTHFLKAQIVAEICRLTRGSGMTQARIGRRLGITQPEVSRLFKGRFREYSVERLMNFLAALDQDVVIVTRPKERSVGRGGGRGGRTGRITFTPLAA